MHNSIIIGAGFAGLCMAIKLKEKGIHDFIILEKADEVGGTWRENTYPGAECDVPSALYSYSFEPYPYWEYKWSHQPQILEYLKHCAKKYELYAHIHFQKEITQAHWENKNSIWEIQTKDGSTYKSKFFTTAIGQLHHPSIPNFTGLNQFQKDSFHSAKWNHKVSVKDKTIGVIGNAASAVQFIPQIAKIAKKVIIFQRSPNWMLPKQDRLYKEWEKKLVKQFPVLLKIYRLRIWLLGGGLFFLMQNGNNIIRKIYERKTKKYINNTIKNPKIRAKLIPKYPMGAKRVLFSDDYYFALNRDNVELIDDPIQKITPNGVQTKNGQEKTLDLLIFSTGFKSNPFLMGINIKGMNGTSIQEIWKDGPKNYLGISVEEFPNMFMLYGPNTNLGHNSIILMIEAQTNYIVQCIEAQKKNKWKSITIKKDAQKKYYESIQERLNNMIWAQVEDSWYKSANGNIPNNWPGRTMEYINRTKKVDFSVYEVT